MLQKIQVNWIAPSKNCNNVAEAKFFVKVATTNMISGSIKNSKNYQENFDFSLQRRKTTYSINNETKIHQQSQIIQ